MFKNNRFKIPKDAIPQIKEVERPYLLLSDFDLIELLPESYKDAHVIREIIARFKERAA